MVQWQDYIEMKPGVLDGKPVFKNTRISVAHILQRLGENWREADLLDSYPNLQSDHIRAAQLYVSIAISNEEIVFRVEQAA